MKEKVMKSTFANEKTAYLPNNIFSSIHKLADKQMPRTKREINNCPEYPSWVQDRSFLSWDFYPNTEKFEPVILYIDNSFFFTIINYRLFKRILKSVNYLFHYKKI